MNKEFLELINKARAEFKKQAWGSDDDVAVRAFVAILLRELRKQPAAKCLQCQGPLTSPSEGRIGCPKCDYSIVSAGEHLRGGM